MSKDKILQELITKYPKPTWSDRSEFLFEDLVETIISQQLSGKAAESIFKRFKQLFNPVCHSGLSGISAKQPKDPGSPKGTCHIMEAQARMTEPSFPTPEQILALEQGSIRAIGVSNSKEAYIRNVAQAFVNKDIEVEKIKTMTDAAVIESLVKIKGVGKWTAEMILIFTLNRPDIFSMGDLGLKNAIKNLYGITEKEKILELIATWSPNKSLACWYLWRSLDNSPKLERFT